MARIKALILHDLKIYIYSASRGIMNNIFANYQIVIMQFILCFMNKSKYTLYIE